MLVRLVSCQEKCGKPSLATLAPCARELNQKSADWGFASVFDTKLAHKFNDAAPLER